MPVTELPYWVECYLYAGVFLIIAGYVISGLESGFIDPKVTDLIGAAIFVAVWPIPAVLILMDNHQDRKHDKIVAQAELVRILAKDYG